jgi:hypothetical protein
MNKNEHLLVILAEECSEISKDVSKSLRFGLDEWSPYDPEQLPNRHKISQEITDLLAVAEMLVEEGVIGKFDERVFIDRKKEKVKKYMEYSKNAGTLQHE